MRHMQRHLHNSLPSRHPAHGSVSSRSSSVSSGDIGIMQRGSSAEHSRAKHWAVPVQDSSTALPLQLLLRRCLGGSCRHQLELPTARILV